MSWDWLVPVCLFGPFVWLLVSMQVEDWQAKKREGRD